MAKNPTGSASDRLPHPFSELLAAATVPPQAEFLVHSVKVVCGRQTETNCCCTAGARPGVYATEVNIQNIAGQPAQVAKFFVPLINAGAVIEEFRPCRHVRRRATPAAACLPEAAPAAR
jgi:hypothetical protein